jgi:hypothetical protein
MTRYHVTMFDPFTKQNRTILVTAPDRDRANEQAKRDHPEWDRRVTRKAP